MYRVRIAFLAVLFCVPLASAFSTTMNVYGNVYNTDGTPLVGVRVQAWMNGTDRWPGNVTTDNYDPPYESYFQVDVQGDTGEQGLSVSFTIQGVPAVQTVLFTQYSSVNLNLTPQSYIQPESIPGMTTTTSTVPQTTTSTTSVPQSTTVTASSTTVPSTTVAASTTTQPVSSTTVAASSTTLSASTSQPQATTSSTLLAASSTLIKTTQPASTTLSKLSPTTIPARGNTVSGGASLRTYLPYLVIGGIVIMILAVVAVIIFLLLKQ